MTLSAIGDAETPAGGSVCMRYNHRTARLAGRQGILSNGNFGANGHREVRNSREIQSIARGASIGSAIVSEEVKRHTRPVSHTHDAAAHTLKSRIRRRRAEVDMMTASVSGEAEVLDFKQLCYRYRLRRKDRKEMRCCVMDVVWTFFGGGEPGEVARWGNYPKL